MEEKGTMHVHLLTELTGNLYSEESEWEEDWSESDEYGTPLDGTELADYEEVIREVSGQSVTPRNGRNVTNGKIRTGLIISIITF